MRYNRRKRNEENGHQIDEGSIRRHNEIAKQMIHFYIRVLNKKARNKKGAINTRSTTFFI